MNRYPFLLCLVVAAPTAACSYEADIARGTTGSDLGAGSGSPAMPSAPEAGGQGSGSDAPNTAPSPCSGDVAFVTDDLPPSTSGVGADFLVPSSLGCSERTEGPCSITVCGPSEGRGPLTYLAAGAMSFSGFPGPVQAAPSNGDPYAYVPPTASGTLWSAGQILQVSATGGEVPAFQASVPFPAKLAITSPVSLSSLSKSAGLSLSWQPANDDVSVFFSELTGSGEIVDISCAVTPPSTGFTLTAAMLTDVVPGAAGVIDTAVQAYSYRTTPVSAGGCQIDVTAMAYTSASYFAGPSVTE